MPVETSHSIPSLSSGNLFEDWAKTVALLQTESDYWVCSEMPEKADLVNVTMLGTTADSHLLPVLQAKPLAYSWYSLAAIVCVAFVVLVCSAPLHT